MKGWNQKKLKDLCDVRGGKRLPPGEIFLEFGNPYIRARDIKSGKVKIESPVFISDNVKEKLKRYRANYQDILLTIVGANIGDVGRVPKELNNANLTENAVKLTNFKNTISQFLAYFLITPHAKELMQQSAAGAAQGKLGIYKINEILVPLPTILIQKKIAAVLSAYDDLIENNNRRIAILEKMAEELYHEWFVRLRFPGHEKTKIIKGIPEGWEVKKIGQVFERYIGGGWGEDFQMPNNPIGAFVIRGTDIPDLKTGNYKLPPFRFHKQTNFASRVLKVGDIIFEVAGGSKNQLLGRSLLISEGIYNFCQKKLICASFCKLIRPAISPFYLSSFLNAFYDCGLVGIFQTQSTGISNYHFEDFVKFQTVSVPNKELLDKFDSTMNKFVDQKDNLTRKNWLLSNSRDKLLSRLMSGKIDLENLDIQFPASMQEDE